MTSFIPVLLILAVGLVVAPASGDSRENRFLKPPPKLYKLFAKIKLGLPFSALGYLCSQLNDLGAFPPLDPPDMARMSFLLRTDDCQNVSIPLTEAERLWEAPGFHQDRPTVIYITGWLTNIKRSNSGPVAKAYNCRNDTNFVVLDADNFIDTLYPLAALNTEVIGAYLAEALLKLDRSYVSRKVHLVGHSLGAQIAGSAGRNFKKLSGGATLARVTGLDPANPCFYKGNDPKGVRSGDAEFVDIIHTNPGVLGTPKVVGDADFFVHGDSPFQTGCGILTVTKVPCSHERAVEYWTETVYRTNGNSFLGKHCVRETDLSDARNCKDTRTVMGHDASVRERGIFYVDANDEEPFGTNANPEAYTSSNSQCGAC
ncbi:phospholipase A1 2-like [Drosophila pseudoobscura]|uniref:Phospholipase A1 2-like n=1 Tax=Drosophila pseudoobscura pseudoobscura TaxID=46245 RepID=A0A6I8V012_DROPS|nr:phospholipase A1 2 [Drosophila pseudoobscura]